MTYTNLHQKKKEEKNRKKVLELIKNGGMSYKQLASEIGYSEQTLSKNIRKLLATKEIEKDILDGDVVYKLGDKGIINPAEVVIAAKYIESLKERGGIAQYNSSRLGLELSAAFLPWGIWPYVLMDKDLQKVPLLKQEDIEEIEKTIFKKIAQNVKNDRIKRNITNGNFQLIFNIDHTKLLESIKANSLNYYAIMPKEESELLSLIDGNPEAVTDEIIEKLDKLREKTYKKLNKKSSK